MNTTQVEQLKELLDNASIVHKDEIMKCHSLKHAHIYCKLQKLSGQVTGPLIENYIKEKYNMEKNSASLCIGDLKHNGVDIEVKVSTGGQSNNKFNYVQMRMNHCCEYLLTAYYIDYSNLEKEGDLYIFRLKKEHLREAIAQYGGYAHGTVKKLGPISMEDLLNVDNDKEYALRPKFGDACWNYLLQYRIEDI
jgi:hypothetical protein